MEAVEGDDLAVLEDALAQAKEKGVEDLSSAEARRAELKELAAAAAPAPAEGEEGEAEAGEAEEEAAEVQVPPLQARGEALLQLPEAVVNYESEDEEAEEEEGEEEQPEAEEGADALVEPEPAEEEDPAVVEARLEAKRARAFERKVKALADAAPDALLAETVVAFCNEAVESGRGFCVGGYPRTLAQAELLEQAFHPNQDEEPTWDGLITLKKPVDDDDAAAPAPAPQEGDAEAEEAQQAAEAAEAERLEAERVVDEIARGQRPHPFDVGAGPPHSIRGARRGLRLCARGLRGGHARRSGRGGGQDAAREV